MNSQLKDNTVLTSGPVCHSDALSCLLTPIITHQLGRKHSDLIKQYLFHTDQFSISINEKIVNFKMVNGAIFRLVHNYQTITLKTPLDRCSLQMKGISAFAACYMVAIRRLMDDYFDRVLETDDRSYMDQCRVPLKLLGRLQSLCIEALPFFCADEESIREFMAHESELNVSEIDISFISSIDL